ncbi:Lrp/AsnC family transcriptional regulator [Mycolicibacterium sp. 018/SC-01/001]|uniref:Lrp/AsnC family transcriptional regulator n=1 Tax=Mycolicibacterium sp. 018/SC-01/001 TaxID=2592069 RepID=UPI00117C1972|nr:Lrp/AsnC family transcriptional regulator [Mycolicibacterium sp. 018/SC-01/001]TRW86146.1 Lrp/AsnC family transcriptional regulator [Mycolicibacterium sp. 018/SC-01/001]
MDDIDGAIVGLLERDGRLTHLEIAAAVGLSRSAAATRVHRLLSTGQVVVRGVVHPAVLGRGALAHLGIVVSGRATPIARALAVRSDVAFLSMTSGAHAIVAELRARSMAEVDRAIGEVRALPDVSGVDALSYVEVVRDVIGPVGEVGVTIDDVDRALLRALQDDGRASYVDLAAAVGLSAAGARRRVVRLVSNNVVRIGAVVRHSGQDRQGALGLGIRLAGAPEPVVTALLAMPAAIFVARVLGRCDVLATVRGISAAQLVDVVDEIRGLPGVGAVESWVHLDVVKENYASGFPE